MGGHPRSNVGDNVKLLETFTYLRIQFPMMGFSMEIKGGGHEGQMNAHENAFVSCGRGRMPPPGNAKGSRWIGCSKKCKTGVGWIVTLGFY